MGRRAPERGKGREAEGMRPLTGCRVRRQSSGDRREDSKEEETGDRKQETGSRRQEAGG